MSEALLVIDVQESVMENGHEKEATIQRISNLIKSARSNAIPVIYVQHEFPEGPMKRGESGWQLHEMLEKPLETETIIYKTLPNSFADTNLKEHLEASGIEHLYITGAQSDYCIDSTCRGAFDNHYDVTLITDAHTTIDQDHLSAEEIKNHLQKTLRNFWSPHSTIQFRKADEVFLKVESSN